jgi:hypothetical protein
MDVLIATFNDLITRKNPFLDRSLTTTIEKLIGLNHNFTQKDFDKFMATATYRKTRSYVAMPFWYPHDDQDKVIKHMFTKFTPSEKQLKLLFTCFYDKYGNTFTVWIDALIEKGFNFNDTQIKLLADSKYDISRIIKKNAVITLDDIIMTIQNTILRKTRPESLMEIMSLYTNPYPDNLMENILSEFKVSYDYDWLGKKDAIEKILDVAIIKGIKFTDNCNQTISEMGYVNMGMIELFIKKGLIPNIKLLEKCARAGFHELVLLYAKKFNLEMDIIILNHMLHHGSVWVGVRKLNHYGSHYYCCEDIVPFLLECGYDETNIINAIDDKNYLNIYTFLASLGIKPNDKTFEISCKMGYYDIFKNCIDEFKFIPSKSHLELAMNNRKEIKIVNDILCYKIIPDNKEFEILTRSYYVWDEEIFNKLVRFGLKITIDDIDRVLGSNIVIDDLERFGIEYDDQLYYICHKHCVFPDKYTKKFKIDKNVLKLRELCRTPRVSIDTITDFMKNQNVKFDRYCMEHAARFNHDVLTYMLNDLKLEPTISLFYWLQYNANNYSFYKLFIEKYNVDGDYLKQEFIY